MKLTLNEAFLSKSLSFKKAFLSIKAFFAHKAVSQFLRCFNVQVTVVLVRKLSPVGS